MDPGAPHPGPQPDLFRFPFAEADDALAVIEDAGAELRAMLSAHDAAVVGARVDFEGETRDGFDAGFAQLMDEVDGGIQSLDAQRDQLADDIELAQRRQEASLDARADWDRAMDRHREAEALPSGFLT